MQYLIINVLNLPDFSFLDALVSVLSFRASRLGKLDQIIAIEERNNMFELILDMFEFLSRGRKYSSPTGISYVIGKLIIMIFTLNFFKVPPFNPDDRLYDSDSKIELSVKYAILIGSIFLFILFLLFTQLSDLI